MRLLRDTMQIKRGHDRMEYQSIPTFLLEVGRWEGTSQGDREGTASKVQKEWTVSGIPEAKWRFSSSCLCQGSAWSMPNNWDALVMPSGWPHGHGCTHSNGDSWHQALWEVDIFLQDSIAVMEKYAKSQPHTPGCYVAKHFCKWREDQKTETTLM